MSGGTYMPAGAAVVQTGEKVDLAAVCGLAVTITESRIARSESTKTAYAGCVRIIRRAYLAACAAVENVSIHTGASAAA